MANPVSQTAWYCCGVRALDAASKRPVCGDTYAQRFMDEEGRAVFARFEKHVFPNRSNAVRHRLVDDLLRAALAANPERRVVLIGCGFDARAYRLGAGRWLEVDEAPLLAYKEARLPIAECPQPLNRVAIDFGSERLEDKLAAWAGDADPVVVVEGVSMYLDDAKVAALIATLAKLWPRHTLICDLMNDRFQRKYAQGLQKDIQSLGATFTWSPRHPDRPFRDSGYRLLSVQSQVERACELGVLRIPWLLRRTLLRQLIAGYRVYEWRRA